MVQHIAVNQRLARQQQYAGFQLVRQSA
jgi:hypothetical protein